MTVRCECTSFRLAGVTDGDQFNVVHEEMYVIHVRGNALLLQRILLFYSKVEFITSKHRESKNFPDWVNETTVDLTY